MGLGSGSTEGGATTQTQTAGTLVSGERMGESRGNVSQTRLIKS